ncbi:S1 family peptidase [Streptomyces antimycoticus]|uniref:S1 family peptidase n=1 Tax=Streptomyces antimycoticus TaxID=68175 RepID=UPI000A3636DA|nr:serine protease [Streptomyces antimycoticus]
MNRSLVGAFSALLLGGATLGGAGAAPAAAASPGAAPAKAPAPAKVSAKAPKAVTFAGTVALSNCSGSVVRTPGSADTDPALVLSNGHCLESGFPGAGEVIVDKPSSRSFTLLTASGGSAGTVRASKVAYATMTDTDISLYQLTSTYAQIQSAYGIKALPLSDSHPTQGSAINVVSGYWKKIYSCNIDGFAYRLKEGDWTWKDSVRYTSACNTIGGTSGSPVVDPASGKVVAVNNTGNEDGGRCTLNNPCEVDENGTVTVRQGINYAQETYGITKCVTTGNKIDLNLAGCALPKP